jgi:hypothetical protein
MPWFGNQGVQTGSLQLTDVDVFGHFDPAFIAGQGNPVPGGNLVSCSVYMAGPPPGQPNTTVQLAVYDTSPGAPVLWALLAVSTPFPLATFAPPAWITTPIAGVLTPGVSYATAVISTNGGAFSGSVYRSTPGAGGGIRTFIAPGIFPNPLGGPPGVSHEWLLYTTYALGGGDDESATGSGCSTMPHVNFNMTPGGL